MEQLFEEIKQEHGLAGAGFNDGRALYIAVKEDSLTSEQERELEDVLNSRYAEQLGNITAWGWSWNCLAVLEMLDISEIDDIARELLGE